MTFDRILVFYAESTISTNPSLRIDEKHIRHPLYLGGVLMFLFIPLALGSFWAFPLALLGALMLVIRIKFEEDLLLKGMTGYADYQRRVKYKLFPYIY